MVRQDAGGQQQLHWQPVTGLPNAPQLAFPNPQRLRQKFQQLSVCLSITRREMGGGGGDKEEEQKRACNVPRWSGDLDGYSVVVNFYNRISLCSGFGQNNEPEETSDTAASYGCFHTELCRCRWSLCCGWARSHRHSRDASEMPRTNIAGSCARECTAKHVFSLVLEQF